MGSSATRARENSDFGHAAPPATFSAQRPADLCADAQKDSSAVLIPLQFSPASADCAARESDGVALPQPFLGVSSLDFGPLLREWPFLLPVPCQAAPSAGSGFTLPPFGVA